MGLDLFLFRFRDKKPAPYDRKIALDIFNHDALFQSDFHSEVRYHDGRGELYSGEDDDNDFTGLMVAHFGGASMFDRIFEVADRTGSLILWTSPETWLALPDMSLLDHIPDELRTDERPPVLVRDGRALMQEVYGV